MTHPQQTIQTLDDRIRRLENQLALRSPGRRPTIPYLLAAIIFCGAAVYVDYRGLGWPNHPYQVTLAAVFLALAYQRHWLRRPSHWYEWGLVLANWVILSVLFKLVIGGGHVVPFYWFKYPTLVAATQTKWLATPSLVWEPTALAQWDLDLTLIQTLLLLLTIVGTLFRFQPFASLTALILIVVSLPTFLRLAWTWVFPSLLLSSLALYFQTSPEILDEESSR
jgi:hypothetical protein